MFVYHSSFALCGPKLSSRIIVQQEIQKVLKLSAHFQILWQGLGKASQILISRCVFFIV